MLTPGLREFINKRNYRFSFLALMYRLNLICHRKFYRWRKWWLKILVRAIIPMIFVLLIFAFARIGNPLWCLLGLALFEGWHNNRFYARLSC